MKNKSVLLAMPILGAVLFSLAWAPINFWPALFVAFIPFLWFEHKFDLTANKLPYNLYVFIGFALWNTLNTWWIWNASPFGAVVAILLNASLMTLPFFFYQKTKKVLGERVGLLAFICYWISFEYFHHNWDLTWPWMTVGNGLANFNIGYQWFEFTGVFGGSLWVILVNIMLFVSLKAFLTTKNIKKTLVFGFTGILFFLIPFLISYSMYSNYENTNSTTKVIAVQPNVDPYNEKFEVGTKELQMNKLFSLTDSLIDMETEFVLWPETSIPYSLYEDNLDEKPAIKLIREHYLNYPTTNFVVGAATFKQYGSKETISARKYEGGECCYDAFNTAIHIDMSSSTQVYHKSKMVPGVEKLPFPKVFGMLDFLTIDLGGMSGSLGEQKERTVFFSKSGVGVAPVICYESVFGEFVTDYVKKGAQFIAIITNDAWWYNTPGHVQHAQYAKIRAVETRRSVVRAANTGTSCFIDLKGDMRQATTFWEPAVIIDSIQLNDELTFYVKNGDYIARFLSVISVLLLLITYVQQYLRKRNFRQ
jgi:apolipoprotein N-acyltransferase